MGLGLDTLAKDSSGNKPFMKTTLLALALAATTCYVFAQGRISIANDSDRLFELFAPPFVPPTPIPNGPFVGNRVVVLALYAGTTSGSMSLQTSYAVTGANWLAPGRTVTKPMTLVGVPGGVPQFFNIILADSNATFPTLIDGNMAQGEVRFLTGAEYLGWSGLFQFTPSTSPFSAPAINGTGTTWPTGSVYIMALPEPSSIVLASLGVISLLWLRRRR